MACYFEGRGRQGGGGELAAFKGLKKFAHNMKPELTDLPSCQRMVIGLMAECTIDIIKTRAYSLSNLGSLRQQSAD